MKTKELLKWLDENAFGYTETDRAIIIHHWWKAEKLIIYKNVQQIDSDWDYFNKRYLDILEKAIEYSMTCMSDREEEKKFYIKPKGDIKKRWSLVEVGIKANGKSIFTLKELEELGIDVNHYDLEEVKND